ncbi:MAG TPA: FliM/FliN family flagellar motor switch protein [Gammaproteobacteria bacterium]|nr:FliM/FliN family flagellar motor switch protein [Gammaproteobacteria bacterium]
MSEDGQSQDSQKTGNSQSQHDKTAGRQSQPEEQVRPVTVGELKGQDDGPGKRLPRSVLDPVTLTLSVELGRAELSFRELQNLSQGAIVELDHMVGDPLEIRANGHLIARGEVVAIKDERYGIRITEVVRQDNLVEESR